MGRKDDDKSEDEKNEEYFEGYKAGRTGDFVRDIARTVMRDDTDTTWDKGYEAGESDRKDHGYKDYDSDDKPSSSSSGLCYLTTACVNAAGLPDDCLELTLMRNFRDKFLLSTSKGRREVSEYYSVAPRIVEAVESLGNDASKEVWARVHGKIRSISGLVLVGENDRAFEAYKSMALELKKDYL